MVYICSYIHMSGISTSNISHHQLQYALINGICIYLCQAFPLILDVILEGVILEVETPDIGIYLYH